MSWNCNCKEFLVSRRSIRSFEDRNVPLELVLEAIDVARYAPSARNTQPWRVIIVRSRELLDKLSGIHSGASPLKKAKLALVVLANKNESPTSHVVDASLFAMYLWLALHCKGLGAVWIQTLRNIEAIRSILDVPEEYVPAGILAVGWPAEKPSPKPRKSVEEIVFLDKYGVRL